MGRRNGQTGSGGCVMAQRCNSTAKTKATSTPCHWLLQHGQSMLLVLAKPRQKQATKERLHTLHTLHRLHTPPTTKQVRSCYRDPGADRGEGWAEREKGACSTLPQRHGVVECGGGSVFCLYNDMGSAGCDSLDVWRHECSWRRNPSVRTWAERRATSTSAA